MRHSIKWQNLPSSLSDTCTTSNNVAPVVPYITCWSKGVSISALKMFSDLRLFSLTAQTDEARIAALVERAAEGRAASSLARMKPQNAELQSKVANNNAGHYWTCFHGALNCLLLQIMSKFVNVMSAWQHQQTHNSEIWYNVASQRRRDRPLAWVSVNAILSFICLINLHSNNTR